MSQTFGLKAIILDRQIFREFDSRITVYSLDHGRLDLIVRGTKRPKSKLAGHIEPLSEVDLMIVKGRKFDYAGSAKVVNAFSKLKNNYDSLINAGQVAKILKRLIKSGEADNRIYFLLKKYLELINKNNTSKDRSDLFLLFFMLKIVFYLGYSPQLNSCLACDTRKEELKYFFNYEDGGLICESCRKGSSGNLLISAETIKVMQTVLASEIEKMAKLVITTETLAEFKKILDIYLRYNLNYKL